MTTSVPPQSGERRRLRGVVVSNRMQKTAVVRVDRMVSHPTYLKRYRVSTRFLVHDEAGSAKPGDAVTIEETRPLSARKRWRIVRQRSEARDQRSDFRSPTSDIH